MVFDSMRASARTPAPCTTARTGLSASSLGRSANVNALRSEMSAEMYSATEPAACSRAMVRATSRPANNRAARLRAAGNAKPLDIRARTNAGSSASVANSTGSTSSAVRPTNTKRSGIVRAMPNATSVVTPRPPPVTTTVSPRSNGQRPCAGDGTTLNTPAT